MEWDLHFDHRFSFKLFVEGVSANQIKIEAYLRSLGCQTVGSSASEEEEIQIRNRETEKQRKIERKKESEQV